MIIGFVRSGVHPQNLRAYKDILKKYNCSVFAICEDLKEKKQYNKDIKVYCLEEWLARHWDRLGREKMMKLSRIYDNYNFWEIYYTDRYMRYKYSYDDAVKLICGMFTFWEYLLKDAKADIITSDCVIGANTFIGMIVGQKLGIPYISTQTARYKPYYSYFSLEEGYRDERLCEYMEQDDEITVADIREAKEYVKSYITNHLQPAYIYSNVNASGKWNKLISGYIKRIWRVNHFFDRKYKNKFNIHEYKSEWVFLDPAKEATRQLIVKRYLKEPDVKEDYFLFPLHFQPEASTCVYARKYEDQRFFIEQLAKSIPAGKVLYVKEHSVRKGHRPLGFYKEISRYPNVKIITWDADPHELIKNASAVVCLTSTAGFEALMYGKPVFLCGKCFYEHFSGVEIIHDVFDEKSKFMNPPVQDREKYFKQMACYLKSVQLCTYQEEPIYEEEMKTLLKIQNDSIRELMKYIDEKGIFREDGKEERSQVN